MYHFLPNSTLVECALKSGLPNFGVTDSHTPHLWYTLSCCPIYGLITLSLEVFCHDLSGFARLSHERGRTLQQF